MAALVVCKQTPQLDRQFCSYFRRLHLDHAIVKFEEFYAQFRESVSSEYPRWLDPVARTQTERANMNATQVSRKGPERSHVFSAITVRCRHLDIRKCFDAVCLHTQVHAQLKEKAKQRFLDLADLVPQMNPGGSGRIMAPEFRNVLNKLGFFMDDVEFDKLWKK